MENDELQKLGEALMPISDVLLICQVDSLTENQRQSYLRGIKTTQYSLNKVIVEQAKAGSKPAQDIAMDMLDKIRMSDGI